MTQPTVDGVTINGAVTPSYDRVLTADALAFVSRLHRQFNQTRLALLARRADRRARLQRGERLDFLAETESIRARDWTVAPASPGLDDRRVEITGPVDRKMMINAFNSGSRVFMADIE